MNYITPDTEREREGDRVVFTVKVNLIREESLKTISENRISLEKHLGHFGMNISDKYTYSQADKESFLNLMEGGLGEKSRAADPFFQEC